MKTLLNLNGIQWIEIILLFQTMLILADAFAGHYRSGFKVLPQYGPFILGPLFLISLLLTLASPRFSNVLAFIGWLLAIGGVIGFVFHYYYGLFRAPKGKNWIVYYLMYGPPLLAPLSLSASGLFAVLITKNVESSQLLVLVVASLAGVILQTFPLHFRGAFNSLFMYAPFLAPLITVFLALFSLFTGSFVSLLKCFLWISFLTGFVGLGMHLRGFDRQRGGLYVRAFNILEGPPAFAPGLYSSISAIALVVLYMF
jgi:hypothetical protein